MNSKLIWLGMGLGSVAGSYIPALWGVDTISFSSLIFGFIGGVLGIWAACKLGE
jgi:hypothetical protein